MLRIAPIVIGAVLLAQLNQVQSAVFSYETRIINPPITTARGFVGHLFLSDNNDYIFEFLPFSSSTKEQGSSIRIVSEGSDYWDTGRFLTPADDDSVMADHDFEIDIVDEPTGKKFSFSMSGELSGSLTFFEPDGDPIDGCTENCYIGDYSSNISFESGTGGKVTMGNIVYELTPSRQVVGSGPSATGVESYLGFNVVRTELLPGDFDHDGIVTGLDYVAWRGAFGQIGMGLWADANCDGTVGAADYVIWRLGLASPGAVVDVSPPDGVPEPVSIVVALFSLAMLLVSRVCVSRPPHK